MGKLGRSRYPRTGAVVSFQIRSSIVPTKLGRRSLMRVRQGDWTGRVELARGTLKGAVLGVANMSQALNNCGAPGDCCCARSSDWRTEASLAFADALSRLVSSVCVLRRAGTPESRSANTVSHARVQAIGDCGALMACELGLHKGLLSTLGG